MLIVPHQLVGIPLLYNASLECIVEAHPTSVSPFEMIFEACNYFIVSL